MLKKYSLLIIFSIIVIKYREKQSRTGCFYVDLIVLKKGDSSRAALSNKKNKK